MSETQNNLKSELTVASSAMGLTGGCSDFTNKIAKILV